MKRRNACFVMLMFSVLLLCAGVPAYGERTVGNLSMPGVKPWKEEDGQISGRQGTG